MPHQSNAVGFGLFDFHRAVRERSPAVFKSEVGLMRRCILHSLALVLVAAHALTASTLHADIQLSAPVVRQVVQRDHANQAAVPIAGTFTGTVTSIEARAVVMEGENSGAAVDWQEVAASPAAGAFQGNLTLAAGGWYAVEVRARDGERVVDQASVERVGVGDVYLTAGQSNSANHGSPAQRSGDRVSALKSLAPMAWQQAHDPQPYATGSGGSPWPALGDVLVAEQRVPVGFVSLGVGSTQVSQWVPGTPHYDKRLKPALELFGNGGFKAVLWHQGESDTLASTASAMYATRLKAIIDQSRKDAGFAAPWLIAGAAYHPQGKLEQQRQVLAGQKLVLSAKARIYGGAYTDDFHRIGLLSDTVHFNANGLKVHGERWAKAIELAFPVKKERR